MHADTEPASEVAARDAAPELSVLIATYNRAELLRRCLDSFARQSEDGTKFEVVVVDDGSSDETAHVLRNYQAPFALRSEHQTNRGQPEALNRALAVARGRFCLFTDDDVTASPRLVAEHLRAQRASGGAVVIGKLDLQLSTNGGLAAYLSSWWQAHYAALDGGGRSPTFTSCYTGNLSAPVDAVRKIGGLDGETAPTHDIELAFRLVQHGLSVVYASHARASQRYTKVFGETVQDFGRRGEAAVTLFQRHPTILSGIPLGAFAESGARVRVLLRVLLAIRAPVWPVAFLDRALARMPGRDRAYRFLQIYCYWRGVRRRVPQREMWKRLTSGVLILLYHAVADHGEAPSRYVLPARALSRQLAWLRRRYTPISLEEYVRDRTTGELPPTRSVVLTFDDGYKDTLFLAYPLLRAASTPATIFLVTAAIGAANEWDADTELAGRELLSWDDIDQLHREGVTFGAHTRSHRSLRALDPEGARQEIRDSRHDLEARLQTSVPYFAYPYGHSDGALESLVQEAGFASAVGIRPGLNTFATSAFDLRRCEIDGRMSILDFAATLALGRPVRFTLLRKRAAQARRT